MSTATATATAIATRTSRDGHGRRPVAWRGLALLATGFAVVLLVASGGYGYHRDELYFLVIGAHPAFGYVDQPPLIPLLAHASDAASGHSLTGLRVPPALAGALVVLVTGMLARELLASRPAQLLAAGCMAVSAVLVDTSHLASTTVFDILGWTVLSWLAVRALRDGGRAWLLVGAAAGVALEVKTLPVFLLFALLVGVLAAGPRDVLRSRWLWAGTAVAVALWLPNLAWQAAHGWPQLALSRAIAGGGSATSQPRWLFLPYQVLLVSPMLTPVWVAGLWQLARDPALATWRSFAVAYGVLVVVFIATGGKPYYLSGLYPVLLAAGAAPTLGWAGQWSRRWSPRSSRQRSGDGARQVRLRALRTRPALLGLAVALSAVVSALLMLPIVPASALHATPIPAINADAGDTVGWPAFVRTVGRAWDALPARTRADAVMLGANYGEAGAVRRYRRDIPAYGAQNSMWDLGPPPAATRSAVVVGWPEARLRTWFAQVSKAGTIDDGVHLDNGEQGEPVWVCSGPKRAWSVLWPRLRRLG